MSEKKKTNPQMEPNWEKIWKPKTTKRDQNLTQQSSETLFLYRENWPQRCGTVPGSLCGTVQK